MSISLSVSGISQLSHLTAFSDDGPGCGTHPPGWHPPFPPRALEASALNAINPQPLPPSESLASLLGSSSPQFDDGSQCGNVPRHLPPPPPPWSDSLKAISSIAIQPAIAQQLGL